MAVLRLAACAALVWAAVGCQALESDPLLGSSGTKSSKPALNTSAFEAYGGKPLSESASGK